MNSPLKLKKAVDQVDKKHSQKKWHILVVDDDPEVIAVSKMVLSHITFMEREVHLLSATSAAEAKQILNKHDDIAIALLDVVMETENAGLMLVQYIREELKNISTRIILRTGQPGQAPEERVIVDYDINDYKSKSELTSQKLFSTVIAALRSYRHIKALDTSRVGLERVINSSGTLFKTKSMREFASGVLTQLSAYLNHEPEGILCFMNRPDENKAGCNMGVLAAAGRYRECQGCTFGKECQHQAETKLVQRAFTQQESIYEDFEAALFIAGVNKAEPTVALLRSHGVIDEVDRQILEVFCEKISLGFHNVNLLETLEQKVKERTQELETKNNELNKALATIKTISGMIPLCAWCSRQVRDKNNEWISLSKYFEGHTDALVSHSICPDCAKDCLKKES